MTDILLSLLILQGFGTFIYSVIRDRRQKKYLADLKPQVDPKLLNMCLLVYLGYIDRPLKPKEAAND